MIKEIIVVEGKDDISAVKRAVDAEVIAVGGYGINAAVIAKIREASIRKGVIVLTDPDFAGEHLRRIIAKRVPGIKHAYIMRKEGTKDGDIGVENASPEAIKRALAKAKASFEEKRVTFTMEDLVIFKLSGYPDSKERRQVLGKALGIGYGNSSSFLGRLNAFGIEREEFYEAVKANFKEYEDGEQ